MNNALEARLKEAFAWREDESAFSDLIEQIKSHTTEDVTDALDAEIASEVERLCMWREDNAALIGSFLEYRVPYGYEDVMDSLDDASIQSVSIVKSNIIDTLTNLAMGIMEHILRVSYRQAAIKAGLIEEESYD